MNRFRDLWGSWAEANWTFLSCLFFSDPASHGFPLSTVLSRFSNDRKLPHDRSKIKKCVPSVHNQLIHTCPAVQLGLFGVWLNSALARIFRSSRVFNPVHEIPRAAIAWNISNRSSISSIFLVLLRAIFTDFSGFKDHCSLDCTVVENQTSSGRELNKRQRLTLKKSLFKGKLSHFPWSYRSSIVLHLTVCMAAVCCFHNFLGHCSAVCFIILSANPMAE